MATRRLHFSLNLSAHEYQAYYSGVVREISTMTREGLRIQFPANALQRFVTHDGVAGQFVIEFDENNKLVGLQKV